MFTILVVHTGKSPTTELRTRLTCWIGTSVLFTHYKSSFLCRGFGERFYFLFRLRFAELQSRHGNNVQRSRLHDLHRLLGVLWDQ